MKKEHKIVQVYVHSLYLYSLFFYSFAVLIRFTFVYIYIYIWDMRENQKKLNFGFQKVRGSIIFA